MLFTGQYEHAIDAKNRLAIPADIRSQWTAQECGGAWYAIPCVSSRPNGESDEKPGSPPPASHACGLIRLYTEADFKARANLYRSSLTPDPDMAELQATLFGLTCRLEMDSAGRVRLPDDLLAYTELPRDVTLVGAGEWLEVRDRALWRSSIKERLDRLPSLLRSGRSAPSS